MDNLTINAGKTQLPTKIRNALKLVNCLQVEEITGLSKSTIYRLMNEGKFPRPVKLSKNRVAWRSYDIENWLSNLPKSGGLKNDQN